jgi:hypothetical protein
MSRQTTSDLTVFIPEFDAFHAGSGSMHIPVSVHGFWSDTISIYVRRNSHWTVDRDVRPAATWEVEITHSSGGRDTDEVKDDVLAHEYFAHAVLAACHLARKIRSDVDRLEKVYQERQAKEQEALDAEKAVQAAAAAADKPLGLGTATSWVDDMADSCLSARGPQPAVKTYDLGELKRAENFVAKKGRDGTVRFFTSYGTSIARKALITKLAASSARSVRFAQE